MLRAERVSSLVEDVSTTKRTFFVFHISVTKMSHSFSCLLFLKNPYNKMTVGIYPIQRYEQYVYE